MNAPKLGIGDGAMVRERGESALTTSRVVSGLPPADSEAGTKRQQSNMILDTRRIIVIALKTCSYRRSMICTRSIFANWQFSSARRVGSAILLINPIKLS